MSLNVMIVDDSETSRRILIKTFEMTGMALGEVVEAADGQEALEKLRDHWVDLVVTDINMPRMSGIELIRCMRDAQETASLPVIVVSTEGSEERVAELRALGVSGFARKPFAPETVRKLVAEATGSDHEQ